MEERFGEEAEEKLNSCYISSGRGSLPPYVSVYGMENVEEVGSRCPLRQVFA